ncbi:MAG: hypothetical protein EBY17_14970 [Acidobacteriia bacterium]|nr:hypothetical protein [Terriglobia bacterium]
MRLDDKSGPDHEAFKRLIRSGRPINDAPPWPQSAARCLESGHHIQAPVAIYGECGRTVVHVQHNRVKASRRFPNYFGDVFLSNYYPLVFQCPCGQGILRISVPFDNSRQDLRLHNLCIRPQ